jgi:cell division septum initiation protein DivIVA
MGINAGHITEEEKLIQEISELEEKLASLKANIPAHSMSVYLMAEIEDTEEEIKQKKEMLKKMHE